MIFTLLMVLLMLLVFFLGKKYNFFRVLLILLYVVATTIYIIWRIGWTLPHNNMISLIFGIILLCAEIGGFVLSLVFYWLFMKTYHRPSVSLKVFDVKYPSIDIFIATYNENEAILKRSISAAKLAQYPQKNLVNIYVCDDGNRDNILNLCKQLNVHYISRPSHEHAKAGNLNYAMSQSHGELIVTMDADMVMRRDFLEKTIGYFNDMKMGFIQTPQTFFNQDPYQFNLFADKAIGNDQDFFMRRIEAQKDRFNSVMYVGSNAIFRREALESINGFTTGVITEDMATGMFLQAAGWKSAFINDNLASGLAPETFGDLVKQRDRWARGNIQVAKKWNPLKLKGLSFIQKVLYIDGIHYWFSGMYKMIFLLAPIAFLVFGQYSLQTDLKSILLFWLPSFISSQLAFNLVADKKQTVTLSNVYESATAPFMSMAVINELFFKSKKTFTVTRKGFNSSVSFYNWRTAWPILILLSLSVIGLLRGVMFILGYWNSPFPIQGIYINIFWILYNLFALMLAAYLSNERPRLRQSERFKSDKAVSVIINDQTIDGHILDWNEDGARIKFPSSLDMETLTGVKEGVLTVEGNSAHFIHKWTKYDRKSDSYLIGVALKELSNQTYNFIIGNTYAQPSSELVEKVPTNRFTHVFIAWWFHTLKKRKSYRNNDE